MSDFGERLAKYLRHKMPGAADLEVTSIFRAHGGASRETYIAQVQWRVGGELQKKGMVVRRPPVASLIETDGEIEYRVYEAVFRIGFPVPEPIYSEQDPRWLDRPFIVISEVKGCQVGNPLAREPYGPLAATLGEQFFTHLGNLAAQDPAKLGLLGVLEPVEPSQVWKRELDHWEKMIDADAFHPVPVVRAAIRWMRRNPPPPPRKVSLVHGDYRSGNFLFDAKGEIKAFLDWEMAHLGDPLEDLGWAIDPLFSHQRPTRSGGMLERAEALRTWERASGMTIDRAALLWWELFSHVKGYAIWVSAAKEFTSGANIDPQLGFIWQWPNRVSADLIASKLLAINARVSE